MFEKRKRRTIIVVTIKEYYECTRTYDYYLTDCEWDNKKTDYSIKGKDFAWINSNTILFIKREKKKKEKES